jgi:hypothetical protein
MSTRSFRLFGSHSTYLNAPTLADDILDRVVHASHKIELTRPRNPCTTAEIRSVAVERLARIPAFLHDFTLERFNRDALA